MTRPNLLGSILGAGAVVLIIGFIVGFPGYLLFMTAVVMFVSAYLLSETTPVFTSEYDEAEAEYEEQRMTNYGYNADGVPVYGIEKDPLVTPAPKKRRAQIYNAIPLLFFFAQTSVPNYRILVLVAILVAIAALLFRYRHRISTHIERRVENNPRHSPFHYEKYVGGEKVEDGYIGGRRNDDRN